MSINRISIKFFIEDGQGVETSRIVPLFHRWIQTDAVPGLLIDVADYKHVNEGPGIILIGHEVDYALDFGHGRAGFLTRHKRLSGGTLTENLQQTLAWAITAAQQFKQDSGLALHSDDMEISFPDRLHTPNNDEMVTAVSATIQTVLQTIYGDTAVEITNGAVDERRPLTLHIAIPSAPAFTELSGTAVIA